eukprot:CAMPEP_0115593508 /NCGR_PEP_ID=MMETSP0272-20121206/11335_1 /TAXON_ID=71861 /ORGANISM="Scrippsiella trochoidea, Strain CCMP3099" /LENGTH=71 /DNA_ID=CAMNT_0003028775 /DNA_START=33 /DNA_END=245 /DNA_ORIENTATION=-
MSPRTEMMASSAAPVSSGGDALGATAQAQIAWCALAKLFGARAGRQTAKHRAEEDMQNLAKSVTPGRPTPT